mmetsp:Transcript_9549/g.28257  ORF Transcript_9549/g.28257 Transcript_9549/m.28257 type:complete len:354 (-) Transcript_9549:1179-2240(-)
MGLAQAIDRILDLPSLLDLLATLLDTQVLDLLGRRPARRDDGHAERDQKVVAHRVEDAKVGDGLAGGRGAEGDGEVLVPVLARDDHEDGHEGRADRVEVGTRRRRAELVAKELHAKEGEDEGEEEDEAGDRGDVRRHVADRVLEAHHLRRDAEQPQDAAGAQRAHVRVVEGNEHEQELDRGARRHHKVKLVPAVGPVARPAQSVDAQGRLAHKERREERVAHLEQPRLLGRVAVGVHCHRESVEHDEAQRDAVERRVGIGRRSQHVEAQPLRQRLLVDVIVLEPKRGHVRGLALEADGRATLTELLVSELGEALGRSPLHLARAERDRRRRAVPVALGVARASAAREPPHCVR